MPKKDYLPRICDAELRDALDVIGSVLIEGAKWCGKTSTAENVARSTLYMQDPDYSRSYLDMADTKPSLLLQGEAPRLIDEWQMAPVAARTIHSDRFRRTRRQCDGTHGNGTIRKNSDAPDEPL